MASQKDSFGEQIRRNESTRDCFVDFIGHRANVMRLLTAASRPELGPACLILLGAGNCNDVDLRELCDLYGEVHLVDLDGAALSLAIERQNLSGDPRIVSHAPIDLRQPDWGLPRATAVASLCVLSQLIDSLGKELPAHSADLSAKISDTIRLHLTQMVGLLQPNAYGVLVTDFASSQTAPQLASATESELPALIGRLLQSRNFFRGLHPGGLYQLLSNDPWFASRISCQIPSSPWNWQVGNRVYAVSALVMRRKIAATGMIEE